MGSKTSLRCMLVALSCVAERAVILSCFAVAAGRPEVSQGQEARIGDFFFKRKHSAEIDQGSLYILFLDEDHSLGHQDMNVIDERVVASLTHGKGVQTCLNHIHVPPPGIHPLSYIAKERCGIGILRFEAPRCGPVFIEARHAAADAAQPQVLPEPFEQIGTNRQHVGSSVPDTGPARTSRSGLPRPIELERISVYFG